MKNANPAEKNFTRYPAPVQAWKVLNPILIIILLSAVIGCSTMAGKHVDVSMTDNTGIIKLDSILIGNDNTKVILEIMDGKKFMAFAPGTYNCFFFMDPITKKEYKLLSGEGTTFNADVNGPQKFSLTFEKLDDGIKLIHLIGSKEALFAGNKTVGFYDINLEK